MSTTQTNPFRELVGLRGVDDTLTTVVAWVNDLSGMSTELVADLSQSSDFLAPDDPDTTDDDARSVWSRVHRNAFDRLSIELTCLLSVDYDLTDDVALAALIAVNATNLRPAYLYLCAGLLMTEKLGSPNLTVFTLSNHQFTERMETKLMSDALRFLKPVARRMLRTLIDGNDTAVPAATSGDITYSMGSYV